MSRWRSSFQSVPCVLRGLPLMRECFLSPPLSQADFTALNTFHPQAEGPVLISDARHCVRHICTCTVPSHPYHTLARQRLGLQDHSWGKPAVVNNSAPTRQSRSPAAGLRALSPQSVSFLSTELRWVIGVKFCLTLALLQCLPCIITL